MKITMYTPAPEGAGGFFRCYFLAKNMVRIGHKVTLICGSPEKTFKIQSKEKEGITIITLPRQKTILAIFFADFLRIIDNIFYEITHDSDIIHVFVATIPSSVSLIVSAKILRVFKLKRHRIIVDWEDWWGGKGIWGDYNRIYNFIGTFFEEKMPQIADMVTVVSDALFKRAQALGIETKNIFKVTNGSNAGSIKLYSKEESRQAINFTSKYPHLICHVGFTDLGAFRTMLEAFKISLAKRKDILLMLVGKLSQSHLDLIKKINIDEYVAYYGIQPYSRMSFYLRASDILLFSMRDSIIETARWPIRIGDYLAAGRPIIATNIGEISKIIRDWKCGICVPTNNANAFAQAITTLIENPNLQEQMGIQARKAAEEEYAWPKVAEQLKSAYQQIRN